MKLIGSEICDNGKVHSIKFSNNGLGIVFEQRPTAIGTYTASRNIRLCELVNVLKMCFYRYCLDVLVYLFYYNYKISLHLINPFVIDHKVVKVKISLN